MSSYADYRVVAIVLFFTATYGIFNFLFWQDPRGSDLPPEFSKQPQFKTGANNTIPVNNTNNYQTTPSFGFLTSLQQMISFSLKYPQLAIINVIWFGSFTGLMTFAILRFIRSG